MSYQSGLNLEFQATGNPFLKINETISVYDKRKDRLYFYFIDDLEFNISPNSFTTGIRINKLITSEIKNLVSKVLSNFPHSELGIIRNVDPDSGLHEVFLKESGIVETDVPSTDGRIFKIDDVVLLDYVGSKKEDLIITALLESVFIPDEEKEIVFDVNLPSISTPAIELEGQDSQVIVQW